MSQPWRSSNRGAWSSSGMVPLAVSGSVSLLTSMRHSVARSITRARWSPSPARIRLATRSGKPGSAMRPTTTVSVTNTSPSVVNKLAQSLDEVAGDRALPAFGEDARVAQVLVEFVGVELGGDDEPGGCGGAHGARADVDPP